MKLYLKLLWLVSWYTNVEPYQLLLNDALLVVTHYTFSSTGFLDSRAPCLKFGSFMTWKF